MYTDVSTPGRSSCKPSNSAGSYSYNLSILGELLTKREYLYTEYFLSKAYSVALPEYLRATPTNSLFTEIQKSYKFADPTNFSSEVSRDYFYLSNAVNNYTTAYGLAMGLSPVVLGRLVEHLFYYSLNLDTHYGNTIRASAYESQFRPMKKGIPNMIRLYATGAIAMPLEIRLHILASSKDIIHS